MNQLQIFKNEEFGEVRSLLINNEPCFVGKDVALILGYSNRKRPSEIILMKMIKGLNESFTPKVAHKIL